VIRRPGAEVRWFVEPHAVAVPLVDWFGQAGPSRRDDHYHVPTLIAGSAIKARAGEQLELKVVAGPPRLIRIGTINATAELWIKQQLDLSPGDLADGWLVVTKMLVVTDTFEVARVMVGDLVVWSIAVKAKGLRRALRDRHFRRWLPTLARSTNAAYPAWILSLDATANLRDELTTVEAAG
jgi:hypothetical protein